MAVRKKKNGGEIMLIDALKALCAEKEISQDTLFDAIESALIFACKKSASADKKVVVDLDRESGAFHVYELQDIVEEVTNPNKEISLADAQKIDPNYELGGVIRHEVPPHNFGRIAVQAAKQFVMQKIREAERGVVYDEFTNKDNDVVNGTITRIEDGNIIVDIGKTEGILVPVERIYSDNYKIGDRVRAYVAEVRKLGKGPQVYLSRTHPGFLRRLFEAEVPELQEGIIIIKGVAREAGNRSKVAVFSNNPDIDPVGACLGEHGVRAQAISNEIGNEKIDVIKWDEDPAIFIANALSPSKVMRVAVSDYDKVSHVVVPNNQLSLAIGKEGQNARLAAKLTGWKIDIKSKAQAKEEEIDPELRVVQIAPDKPKKSKFQKQQKPQKPKPEPILDENGNVIPPETSGKKKKKKAAEVAAAVVAVADNPFGDNPFSDNPFEDNPFDDGTGNAFDAAENVSEETNTAEKPKTKSADANFDDNLFNDNPFENNPFGDDSFESENAAETENNFVDESSETEKPAPEIKPDNKKSSKKKAEVTETASPFEDNPFGDNPFDDSPFE